MAYAALVSLEQTIDQILNQGRYSTSLQAKHRIVSLDKYVISFQAFLEEFLEKAKNLEAQIRDAATAAEDIIECFMLDQIRWSYGCIMWIDDLAGIKFEYELNKVAEKMEMIAAEMVEIKNIVMIEDKKLYDSSIVSSSSAVLPSGKLHMVGFDDDLLEIKSRLVGESPNLQFLSISGMGGIGKTTLARNAYDDQLIQEHFQIRAWVTISQDYRAPEIISCLRDSMKEFNPKGSEESVAEMAERVYKTIKGRRYIIVMDDTWSTEVLDGLKKLFPDDGNGSRIMLTTRLSDVAAYLDSSPYEVRLMDEKKSWDLLKQKISRDFLSDELEMIGHEIARSCRGLPLAVVVIAGILSSITETPASWAEIAKNIKKATSKDERLEQIVSLGYSHLPHPLRPCLIYMGFLPEDYSIRVSLLIKLWIAEGFLKHPKDSSKSLEVDAEEYLEDLVRRNLIMVNERKYNGKIKSCSLHDMVRDTCIRMLEEEKHLRHVTTTDNQGCISKRSLLSFDSDNIQGPSERFRLLRVVHAPNFVYNSRKMLKLYHLRHICFNYSPDLPKEISSFQNLQSLVFHEKHSFLIKKLPSSIWKLRQLRHLIFRGCLPSPYVNSALENLQTLKEVYDTKTSTCLLQRIPNLKKLGLIFMAFDSSDERHLNESLVCLRELEKLKISFTHGIPKQFGAVFPSWLKKCTLEYCRASVSFLEAIGSLPNLEALKLMNCAFDDATWEVRGGEFPLLKILRLSELEEITTFIVEDDTAFPMLNCLYIHRCYHLVELSDEIGDIPTLQLIEVSRGGVGVCNWARRIEEEQQSLGNDTFQVRCIYPEEGMLPRKYADTTNLEIKIMLAKMDAYQICLLDTARNNSEVVVKTPIPVKTKCCGSGLKARFLQLQEHETYKEVQ